jgi:hypothetical protein
MEEVLGCDVGEAMEKREVIRVDAVEVWGLFLKRKQKFVENIQQD